ncbi:MAG: hypothetical protein Q7S21_01425 [archaeon]|nr:hypothetical protein [archaeon]
MPFKDYTDETFNEIKSMQYRCKQCSAKKYFKKESETTEHQTAVLDYLKKLAEEYNDEFNRLRRKDSTTLESINALKDNKYLCMDLITVCKKCDKEVDRVNRESVKLKRY